MTGTALLQLAPPVKVCVVCNDCEETITGDVRKDLNGNSICEDCFEDADLAVCENCDKVKDRDACRSNPDGDLWCDDCMCDSCCTCEHCDNEVWSDYINEVTVINRRTWRADSEYWCESCIDRDAFHCDDCGGTYSDAEVIHTAGGSGICQSCYEDYYFTCEDCGEVFHHDDTSNSDDGCFCQDCGHCGEDFGPSGFRNRSGRVTETGSARCYGIELETDRCEGYSDLDGSGAWGAKNDPTVSGKEFYSDILNGDEGLDAVREWAELADRNRWYASSSAGYHLHIDMRNESDDQLYAIAYAYRATQEVWLKFVSRERSNGTYSHRCSWDTLDIPVNADERSFYSWSRQTTRYMWFNTNAFSAHSTFEIRAHEGTCDGDAVINWVKAHTRFADWASSKGLDGVRKALDSLDDDALFDLIAREAWQDDELRDYYAKKADNH